MERSVIPLTINDVCRRTHRAWDNAEYALASRRCSLSMDNDFTSIVDFLPGKVVVVFNLQQRGNINVLGYATMEEYTAARRAGLGLNPKASMGTSPHPAFLDLVHRQLRRDYDEADLRSEGLRVFTTLDPRVHAVRRQPGQQIIAEQLRELLRGSQIIQSHVENDPRVQDPYSFRCCPAVLGAVWDLPAVKDMPAGTRIQETGDAEIMGEVFAGFATAMATGLMLVLVVLILYKEFLFVAFDPVMAAGAGIKVSFYDTLLLVLLALTATISMRALARSRVNLIALETRLTNTCCMSPGSTCQVGKSATTNSMSRPARSAAPARS